MYTINQLQKDLVQYAKEIGVDKIGFTTADPFSELKNRLKRQQELNYQSGFEEPDIELRTEPLKLLDKAESIISIALAYPSKMPESPQGKKGSRRGIFCRSSWGVDYHTAVGARIKLIETWLQERMPEVLFKSMVDTGELVDRAVAERAGVGWSGKNCCIITPEYGSYVYLGELITNIPFKPDKPIENECGDCTLCLDVCPTGALVGPGQLNAQRCISFLTQTKTIIPIEFRESIGNRLYGCDTCQTICPKNRKKINWIHEEMMPDPEIAKPLLEPLLTISNKDFKAIYGHVSGAWRGKKPIQRNALIALGNFKEESAIPTIKNVLFKDERPVIRGTAAWALGKINTPEAEHILLTAKNRELDELVSLEIIQALDIIQQNKKPSV